MTKDEKFMAINILEDIIYSIQKELDSDKLCFLDVHEEHCRSRILKKVVKFLKKV